MDNLYLVIIFSLIGGLLSLIGGFLLLGKKSTANILANYATPFAAGGLLATVFIDLLREGIHEGNPETVLNFALIGIVIFFFAERFLRWFHHHHAEDKDTIEDESQAKLIIVGDSVHNFMDGIAIAAAFLISVPTGIVTAIVVALHEIPQEIGDFGLLLSKGYSRKKVLLINIFSALLATVAAVITYVLGVDRNIPVDALLGLSAGFLLYIALSDIIPTIHTQESDKKLLQLKPMLLLLGVIVVGVAIELAHGFLE